MDGTENGLSFLYWINQQLLPSIQKVGKYYRTCQNYFQCHSVPKPHNGKLYRREYESAFLIEFRVFLLLMSGKLYT